MTHRWADIRPTPGTVAGERLPRGLAPARFRLRPQTLAESFCAAGKRLGAQDVQLARNNRHARPWARLFQNEPAYLYSELLSFRADDAGFVFAEALEAAPEKALRLILDLARRLDGWITRIRLDAPAPFSKQLDQLDKEANLTSLLAQIVPAGPTALLRLAESHPSVRGVEHTGGVLAKARATRERLRGLHALLRNAVSSLQVSAQSAFDQRIRSGQIDPGLGLLIAELRTAAHVDAAINRITDRHTTLYYTDMIGQTPASASPEMVLLELGAVQRSGYLPQGARLEARLGNGAVQQFETDAGVPLSPSKVSDIRLLSYETDENISYHRALGGITGLRAARLDPTSQSGGDTLFGTGTRLASEIGIDIASPMLSLAEGVRRIEVSLHMARASNLPALSRRLTPEEIAARDAARRQAAYPNAPPNLRRNIASMPDYADPEVRLALAADPTLVAAFSKGKPDQAIETLTHAVTVRAERMGCTTSLGLIYEGLMDEVSGPSQLRLLLGRIVTLSLIEQHPFPAGEYWEKIYGLIDRYRTDLVGKTPADPNDTDHGQNSMIFAAFSQRPDGILDYPPEDVFQSLLGDAFDISVSTDSGPRQPDIMQVLPLQQKRSAGGITLALRYDKSAPALSGPQDAPRLALRYAANARLCPLSFFEAYSIETVTIRTQVSGLRRLVAFSDDAPISTDQTFQPFGPRPSEGASFLVGCAEMARKPVTHIGLHLGWTGMPDPVGGFATHYESYGRGLEIPAPRLSIEYLSGDGWKKVGNGPVPLFQTEEVTGELLPDWRFNGRIAGHSISAQGAIGTNEFQSRQTIRAGMVRLRLDGTAGGFHADRYPVALVQAMRPRILPIGERKLPPPPFVPEIKHISISYTAEATIELNAPDTARPGEELRQISPFGSVGLFPRCEAKAPRLFPERLGYGMAAFQITGPKVTGPITLTICLAPSGHLRCVPEPNPLAWYYLAAAGWQPLSETAIGSDTTNGLIRSGTVIFDLPDDAVTNSTLMPNGGAWVAAVATRPRLEVFPALARAKLNGVWARRNDDTWNNTEVPRKWSFNPAQPGLTIVNEIAHPITARAPEPRDTFLARIGERLRHRRRGVTPWDMERMVLEEFPEVWMAKCLPHLSKADPAPAPGKVTLVAVRGPLHHDWTNAPEPALFDVATLERIRGWLAQYCSDAVTLDVVNPTFERLQVRAKIALNTTRENGAVGQLLRRELARSLSVWSAGFRLRRFGWSLNMNVLRAHVAGLDYVRDISDFSVLHFVGDDYKTYQLLDTAQDSRDPRGTYGPVLRSRFPWGLPISARDHAISLQTHVDKETPTVAGIGSLTLGEMLIVGQRTHP